MKRVKSSGMIKGPIKMNYTSMKSNINYLLASIMLLLISCSEPDELAEKKEELQGYKNEMQELKVKIAALEDEISDLDPDFAKSNRKATLVTTTPVEVKDFEHYIEVSGEVSSRQNIVLTAEVPAVVEKINVQEGDRVTKGQVLLVLDASGTQRSIDELKTALELATTVYQRQANLWKQKIGTEIQYLEAKNKKEALERQLQTAQVQLAKSIIRAPFAGTVEEVVVKVGETAMVGSQLIRIVGSENMYVEADVSEAYIGSFEKGDSVELQFPSSGESYNSVISSIGRVINKENRTFDIEVKLPSKALSVSKPNQLAVVKIKDFEKSKAIVVPTNLIQSDNRGQFVYIVDRTDSVAVAEKVHIERGMTYKNETLVKSGLTGKEELIDQGFREVAEGLNIKEAQSSL